MKWKTWHLYSVTSLALHSAFHIVIHIYVCVVIPKVKWQNYYSKPHLMFIITNRHKHTQPQHLRQTYNLRVCHLCSDIIIMYTCVERKNNYDHLQIARTTIQYTYKANKHMFIYRIMLNVCKNYMCANLFMCYSLKL